MVKESVEKTIEIITSDPMVSDHALKEYRKGLNIVRSRIGNKRIATSHVSLTSKGSVENPRSKGGRSAVLIKAARAVTDLPLSYAKDSVGCYDQFGQLIISKSAWELSERILARNVYLQNPTIGDLLYVQTQDIEAVYQNSLNMGRRVPTQLAQILNMIASKLMLRFGDFVPKPAIKSGILCFKRKECTYVVTKKIPTKADLSLESGMKARLTTSALAGFSHLSQLPSNAMREYLSNDPFNKVGFEEAHKLWEVLKQYRKLD